MAIAINGLPYGFLAVLLKERAMKNDRLVVEDRQRRILDLVRERNEVRNEELAALLGVSLMTVRRDLGVLEQQRLLKRSHGGAMSIEKAHTTRYISDDVHECRQRIASYAAGFLNDGDRVFINGSRLALNMLEHAGDKKVSVYTNNGWAFSKRFPKGVNINFTGGEMHGHVMVGELVVRNLLAMEADKAFLGCAAIYHNVELRYDIFTEISINEMMVSRTKGNLYLLADHTKLKRNPTDGYSLSGVTHDHPMTLITDDKADPDIVDQLRKNGMEVFIVGA